MREEGSVDRDTRRRGWLGLLFFFGYCSLVVYLLMNPVTRIVGVFNVPVVDFMFSHYFLKSAMEDPQRWWRQLVYRRGDGKSLAFEDRRVRVLDGERHIPSRVFAADIFD